MDERDPLGLDAETMRALGHRTVDMLVDQLSDPSTPVLRRATGEEMAHRLDGAPPAAPQDFEILLRRLSGDVLPFMSRCDHPRYFAFIPANGTFPGALGDFIASALNIFTGSWMEAAGPSRLELIVLGWFKEWIGYPADAAGVLLSGGSAANMTALACAREALLGAMSDRAVVYVSDQAHSSLARAARVLGFRPDQMRVLPTDARYRMRPDALAAAVEADLRGGRRPVLASATAGATNTGAIDPLADIADVCAERGLWFHVDAAYGGFAALSERGRRALAGIERADSVALDPHKWLYQPFECGCLLVREGSQLRRAFEIAPDYLKDAQTASGEVNFSDLGLQLTRSCRALKVWLSVSYFGTDAFRAAVERSMRVAERAEREIRSAPELELLSPANLGIVCFRRRGGELDDEEAVARANAALVDRLEATGDGLVSSTRLRGRYAVRLCVLNHTSGPQDAARVIDWFAHTPVPPEALGAASPQPLQRSPSIEAGWLSSGPLTTDVLARLPLFADLEPELLRQILGWARERRMAPATTVTERWEGDRDFYVILEGHATVDRGDGSRPEMGPGDFFGELAAIDWGAGFGYPRLATVTAATSLRLLVLDSAHLQQLMRDSAGVAQRVGVAVDERLPGL